jgi:NAD(P)-dependent dehydrogenase (short-subunit alcohol dehydrogenase family)
VSVGNKTVLVTGTSTGFGRSAVNQLAGTGWNVIATMRNPDASGELDRLPDTFVTHLDVCDPASIDAAISRGLDRFGRIDAIVNNAGDLAMGLFEAMPDRAARDLFDVNYFGMTDVTRAILPHFREIGKGLVVNVSSTVALIPLPLFSQYAASKAAVEAFTEGLAYELAAVNIRVKLVQPGAALTALTSRVMDNMARLPTIPAYGQYVAHIDSLNARLFEQGLPGPEACAKTIVEALNDPSDRLRYLSAADFVGLLDARKKQDDETFLTSLRAQFLHLPD